MGKRSQQRKFGNKTFEQRRDEAIARKLSVSQPEPQGPMLPYQPKSTSPRMTRHIQTSMIAAAIMASGNLKNKMK